MTAIENCRAAALAGNIDACEKRGHWRIAYNCNLALVAPVPPLLHG